jgi:hypothetical protein
MTTRTLLSLAAVLVGAGCTTVEPIRFEATGASAVVRAAAADVTSFVRAGWHLPLTVRVHLSNAADGQPLPPDQLAREEALAARQLAEVREAYAHAAFDFFEVDMTIGGDGSPAARVTGDLRRLVITLPATSPDVVGAHALIEALGDAFAWDAVGRWYAGESTEDLVAAQRRDLAKLDRLEDQLAVECRRLEMIAATLDARAVATGQEPLLTPSEATFARGAQYRATFNLHRALNTFARWRVALDDDALSVRDGARLVAMRAAEVHAAYLDWVLDVVVGERPVLAVWQSSWWHRHPLYAVLDASAPLDFVDLDGAPPGSLPAGSVRALLRLRYATDLDDCYEAGREAGEQVPAERFAKGPLEAEARAAWARSLTTRAVTLEHGFGPFAAWKETWDARLKSGFSFPFYQIVARVSCFLGDTRTSSRPPAVSLAQAEALERRLRPGDLLLVRQDDFLSNAFLPGFWPHALVWLGAPEAWTALRLADGTRLGDDPLVRAVLPRLAVTDEHGLAPRSIEAVSEGVVFSSIGHVLHKDYVVALRPTLSEAQVAESIRRALALHGRPYDFSFDFATDDRVVCTELVYRAYDPHLNFRVQVDAPPPGPSPAVPGVAPIAGRIAMTANDIARYALHMLDHPQPSAALRYPGKVLDVLFFADRAGDGVTILDGERAVSALRTAVDR